MESSDIFEITDATSTTPNIDFKNIPTVKNENLTENLSEKKFLDIFKPNKSKNWFHKFSDAARISPFFQRIQSQSTKSNLSHYDPTTCNKNEKHFLCLSFFRKISRESIVKYCKNWIKHPMNKGLLVWFFFVATCLLVLFLFMVGLLNQAIPDQKVQQKWTEIVNQILNALFTIMCLYQHPRIVHHLILLCCWRSKDIIELRNIYCKNGTKKSHERIHMMFVVILLHITCLAQYGLCALIWAYTLSSRPTWPQVFAIVVGTAAPIIAAFYTFFGPLAKKTETEDKEEVIEEIGMMAINNDENKTMVETSNEWVGGIFDCWDDPAIAFLSFFCTFFVFGWNMERLGFGNMYVHIFTFIILCVAPVIVFGVTAHNVNDIVIKYIVWITGIVLCMFGLLYGGYWRIEMRKKFFLPKNQFFCGYSDFNDFMQWLFCWSCSLAQEVRTGDFYDVEHGILCRKECEERNVQVLDLSEENGAEEMTLPIIESARIYSKVNIDYNLEIVRDRREEIYDGDCDEMMRPPIQLVV